MTVTPAKEPKNRSIFRGMVPASMLDWEGKLTLSLFVGGCNFRCSYCHNPELVLKFDALPAVEWEEIESHLKSRKGWLDGIVIGGGEPTLHPEIIDILKRFRKLGYPVKLDTNGSFPDILEEIVKNDLVSFIAMDVKASLENYPKVVKSEISPSKIALSVEMIKGSAIEHEFRTTVVPGLIDKKEILSIARLLKGGDAYVLQQFNPKTTLDKSFQSIKPYSANLLKEWAEEASDFIPTRVRGV